MMRNLQQRVQNSCQIGIELGLSGSWYVHRLDLAESIRAPTRGPRRNPFETALAEAERQEAAAGPPAELPFSATILCVGITGVGKTATIHSVLGLPPPGMGGFEPQTKQVSFHGFWCGVFAALMQHRTLLFCACIFQYLCGALLLLLRAAGIFAKTFGMQQSVT